MINTKAAVEAGTLWLNDRDGNCEECIEEDTPICDTCSGEALKVCAGKAWDDGEDNGINIEHKKYLRLHSRIETLKKEAEAKGELKVIDWLVKGAGYDRETCIEEFQVWKSQDKPNEN